MLSQNKKISEKLIPLDPVSGAIWLLASILSTTWRYRFTGSMQHNPFKLTGQGVIFCFWHCHILIIGHAFRGCGVKAMVSQSRDGERIGAIAQRWRHGLIRGSSSTSAVAALREGARELGEGRNIAITPDGPRGPRRVAKDGCAQIAQLSGAPIIPLRVDCSRQWTLDSWDKFVVPKVGARITISIGAPILARTTQAADTAGVTLALNREIENALGA
ncbi:MAG: lysophospholipid acyltransferase family protein [Chitinivibrionales bacterium]|nr:lysophospholipid acyltransferase family protein [Chitinivibrionales bacterium]